MFLDSFLESSHSFPSYRIYTWVIPGQINTIIDTYVSIFCVILLHSLSYTEIYYIKLQNEIVWEPQGVKKLTTSVNNAEHLEGHCMLSVNNIEHLEGHCMLSSNI